MTMVDEKSVTVELPKVDFSAFVNLLHRPMNLTDEEKGLLTKLENRIVWGEKTYAELKRSEWKKMLILGSIGAGIRFSDKEKDAVKKVQRQTNLKVFESNIIKKRAWKREGNIT